MSIQWVATYTPALDSTKQAMSVVGTGIDLTANQVALYVGDNVPLYRQVEIIEGWRWLSQGVRERNLLDEGSGSAFPGALLYTGAPIDGLMSTSDRRTSSTFADFTEDDVFIGMGTAVTAAGDTESLHAVFTQLRQFALEATLKAA
jgi:hypothetical protein